MPNVRNVQRLCPNCNHYYDSSLPECPVCSGVEDNDDWGDDTGDWGEDDMKEKICPRCGQKYSQDPCPFCNYPNNDSWGDEDDPGETEPRRRGAEDDDGKTVVFSGSKDAAVVPVVGWLVCTKGVDMCKDFRLHAENNFVGRRDTRHGVIPDVCLSDKKVSRGRHFSVVYAPDNDLHFVTGGSGTAVVYLNNIPVGGTAELKKGDKIRVGDTTLVFIPLEKSDVQWEWD